MPSSVGMWSVLNKCLPLPSLQGVKPEDFDVLAENSLKDACGFTNPRPATHADIVALFRQAYEQGEEAAAPEAATA